MNPFAVLGISSQSTETQVKRRYRVLAFECHPDKAGKNATARFQDINAVYQTIIEKRLYSDPEKSTEQNADHKPKSGLNSKHRPGASQQRPSSQTSQSSSHSDKQPQKPRPTGAQQPPCRHARPQPEAYRPQSTVRDDSFLQNFAKIKELLSSFSSARILQATSTGSLRGWPEAYHRFTRFDDMVRKKMCCFHLSSQLGTLVCQLKMLWAQRCGDISSQSVRNFSFAAMLSVMRIKEQDFLTRGLWRVAEKAFVKHQEHDEALDRAEMDIIKPTMLNTNYRMRRMYRQILSTLFDFLKKDKIKYPHQMTSPEGIVMEYKVAVQLKCANISDQAGVSCEWVAVDVGRIIISLRTLRADRLVRTESGRVRRHGVLYGFDHWMGMSGLAGVIDAELRERIRAAFYRNRDVTIHPFSDMFVPPEWVFVARARQSRLGGMEERWWRY